MKLIMSDGLRHHRIKKRDKRQTLSVMILADAQLAAWPKHDKKCVIVYKPGMPVKQWSRYIRAGTLDIQVKNVLIYFEALMVWSEAPPIKNTLQSVCKAIRGQQPEARIYVANMIPRVGRSPVVMDVSSFNFVLQEAVCSVGRALSRVHNLALFEHFMSSKGKILNPKYDYFNGADELTYLGCLVLRECVLREMGLKTYWFDGPRQVTGANKKKTREEM